MTAPAGVSIPALCLLMLLPHALASQDAPSEARVAAFIVVAEYADSVATWNAGGVEFLPGEVSAWSADEEDRADVREAARRLGMGMGSKQESLRCEPVLPGPDGVPMGTRCEPTSEARAGFSVRPEFAERRATVDLEVWGLYELRGLTRAAVRSDRLHLVRSDEGWRITEVEILAHH